MKSWEKPEMMELDINETACIDFGVIISIGGGCGGNRGRDDHRNQPQPCVPSTPLFPAIPTCPSDTTETEFDANALS